MRKQAYDATLGSPAAELQALSESAGARPATGDEHAAMAGWVALCLSAFGEASEELLVNEDDEMARAADARSAILGAARMALDSLEEVCGVERESAISMIEDRLTAGSEFDTDEHAPPTVDAELYLAREAAVYELSLAAQAAAEMVDAELRREFFVKGMVGFATVATAFSRNVRRWAAAGE